MTVAPPIVTLNHKDSSAEAGQSTSLKLSWWSCGICYHCPSHHCYNDRCCHNSSSMWSPPVVLVMGTSMVRHVAVCGGQTVWHQGACLTDVPSMVLHLTQTDWSAMAVVVHVHINDRSKQSIEALNQDLIDLIDDQLDIGKQLVISGPIPTSSFRDDKFSWLRPPHLFFDAYCRNRCIPFVDNFMTFYNKPELFRPDRLHLSRNGMRLLSASNSL